VLALLGKKVNTVDFDERIGMRATKDSVGAIVSKKADKDEVEAGLKEVNRRLEALARKQDELLQKEVLFLAALPLTCTLGSPCSKLNHMNEPSLFENMCHVTRESSRGFCIRMQILTGRLVILPRQIWKGRRWSWRRHRPGGTAR